MKHYILLLSVFTLSGCTGTGKIMVMDMPTEQHIAKTYTLLEGKSTVGCDESVKKHFEQELRDAFSHANMLPGNDLIIEYRFVQFDEGSRFVRYISHGFGNAGEGEMTVEVIFKNSNNKELGKVQVGGKINGGFFGGSFDHAVEQSANQIVKYVITNFRK